MTYTVKMVAAQLDVKADTLRKWEARYALVSPRRGGNRYRLYGDEELRRLHAFVTGVRGGTAPAAAAAEARGLLFASPTPDKTRQDRALEAIERLDRAALAPLYDDTLAEHGLAGAFDRVWTPLLIRLGEVALARKGLWIACEHFAVSFLRERVAKSGVTAPRRKPRLSLSSPEGDLHELGMLAAAAALSGQGLEPLYLGVNLPLDSLLKAHRETGIRHACLTLTRRYSRPALKRAAAALKRRIPGGTLCIAGQGSLPHANLARALGVVFVGANLQIGLERLREGLVE
ncbi:MAG: MerR family transcriptional regulator [Elusimicrobia bacterium]|nr:MerR family transcriptional regulator [Elusimicrobiota bacterium]